MRFALESKIRKYFENLNTKSSTGKLGARLEYWWLCALVGLVYNKYNKDMNDSVELTDNFTTKLKPFDFEIRALGFYNYINKNLVEQSSKAILRLMEQYFDSDSLTKLSDAGIADLNYYASGGFQIIEEKIPVANDLTTFLISYLELLMEKIGD
jgi:hypothetical protein